MRRALMSDLEAETEKDSWLSTVLREWGSCGRVLLLDDVAVGFVVYAPAALVPGAERFATAPVSHDAVVLTTLYVAPEHRESGLGRVLVQAMAADLIERGGVRAVETFGRATWAPSRSCVLPVDFLAQVGFRTVRHHPTTPRMRMDLRSAVTWREEVEAALGRLVGALRPAPAPLPETRTGSRRETDEGPRLAARPFGGCCGAAADQMKSASSLRIAALGRAPTMVLTTSPPW